MRKAFLCDFIEHQPPERIPQAECVDWLERSHMQYHSQVGSGKEEQASRYIRRFSVSPKSIGFRASYVPGIGNFDKECFFNESNLNPKLEHRGDVARDIFRSIFRDLYFEEECAPEHLFHVSCTHYESPSAAQNLVGEKSWNTATTHFYHMGCYASLPAVRAAKSFVSDGAGRVDIAHTEICSLHLNPTTYHPELVIAQSLFADGAIRYSCLSEERFTAIRKKGFEVVASGERLIPGTGDEMTWKTGSHRFDMTLSKNVPGLLAKCAEEFCRGLFAKAGLNYEKDKDICEFAVHPGGPKIVDSVQECLSLTDRQVSASKSMLFNRGNMSSATLPHIWKVVLEKQEYPYVASLGFGPGLTIIGALFKLWNRPGY